MNPGASPYGRLITGGCAPVPGIERKGERCRQFVEEGLRLARRRDVDTV